MVGTREIKYPGWTKTSTAVQQLDIDLCGRTIKFANLPPCACRGSTGQKPWYSLMTLTYQHFTAVLLLIHGSLFLSGIYYCLRVFWCAVARMSELKLEQ